MDTDREGWEQVWWREKAPPHQANFGLKVSHSWSDCDYHGLILSQREGSCPNTNIVSWVTASQDLQ